MSKIVRQTINSRLLTIISLSLSLFFTPIALAGFKPTNRKPASDYSRSGGKRGCPEELNAKPKIPLTLLAPQTYVGYTSSLRPTFVGFVSSPQKVKLKIFEFISDDRVQQIGDETIQNVKTEIFQITLPEKYPDLTLGKKYLWQLTLSCPKIDIVERAEFIVAKIPSSLNNELSTTRNSWQKANIYAKEGFWYDALAEALQLANDGKLGKLGSTLVTSFAEYELPRPKEAEGVVKERIQNLQMIATQQQ